jgi:hypothetical protein
MLRPLLLALALALTAPAVAADIGPQNPAPPGLYGTYGPGGNCKASPRVSLDASGLYIVIGTKRGKLDRVDACFSCAGGARYEGIEVWLAPATPGGNGFMVIFRFNADEVPGNLVAYDNGEVALGPNLQAVVAASPFRRCGPPTQAAPK